MRQGEEAEESGGAEGWVFEAAGIRGPPIRPLQPLQPQFPSPALTWGGCIPAGEEVWSQGTRRSEEESAQGGWGAGSLSPMESRV